MLPLVKTPPQKLERYEKLIPAELLDEIKNISKDLQGLKVFHVNATPRGGGVAEILKNLVPLMNGVGLDARWFTIPPRDNFFEITKKMHNALQGKKYQFPFSARKKYLYHMARTAALMKDMKPDVWVIHDPQPAGLILFLPNCPYSISRLHIDLTSPNREVWRFVAGFLEGFDKIIVTSEDFIKKEIEEKALIIPPAIDILSPQNNPISKKEAKEILTGLGIDVNRPLVTQVSRFDPWKDPLGVVEAYRLAKKKIPGLQLAYVGLFLARDDPEAERVYKKIKRKTEKDSDVFLFAEREKLGSLKVSMFVNAMQVASDVILQKSIREGFGMTVSEAMWKEKPVIGGNVGGIKLQIENGKNGFLVSSSKETSMRIVELINNPEIGERIGKEAKETVRKKFSIPRLLRDYLKVFKEGV